MYYAHFGLAQPPFRITPNTDFFYSGGNRGPILEALIYTIGQGEGIIKVTGEVGSGKTMLCNMLPSRLPPQIETIYLANPSVAPEEILHAIAFELQLKIPRDTGRLEVMQALQNYLLERHAQGKQVVMFIEESQSIPLATLEEIRLLSNLETQNHKLLQIVLFGQPELDDNLRQPKIRQLRERITHSFRLGPLKAGEIREYLNFRLRAAGYRGPDLFTTPIVTAIAKASRGVTRRLNLIADKALLAAFAESTHTLKRKHIKAAVRDSEFSNYEPPVHRARLQGGLILSLLAIGAGTGIAIFALIQTYRSDHHLQSSTAISAPIPPTPPRLNVFSATTSTPSRPAAASPISAVGTPMVNLSSKVPGGSVSQGPALPLPRSTSSSAITFNPSRVAPAMAASPSAIESATVIPSSKASGGSVTQGLALPLSRSTTTTQPSNPLAKNGVSVRSLHNPGLETDLLAERLAATQAWLAQQDKNTYSIQLLGTGKTQQLKQHLNVIRKYIEINDIFVYRTSVNQKPWLTVLYGSFNDRRSALAALAALPSPLKAYRPYLRTVQGIRAETALSAAP